MLARQHGQVFSEPERMLLLRWFALSSKWRRMKQHRDSGPQDSTAAERRLKVLHVVRQFDPSTGGLETYVKELASRQSATFDVTVLTLNRVFGSQLRLPPLEQTDRFNVIRIPFVGFRRLFLPFFGPSLLKSYDVVHVHAADQLLDVTAAMIRLTAAKLFMTTHGLYFHTETLATLKKVYLRTISKWSLGRTQAIFAVSRNDASTLKGVGIESVLLRNPIVPLGDFICEGKDLLYLGRISANKRLDALIAFMAHLVNQHPSISLHIVGGDNEKLWTSLAEEVARRNLQNNILYHGYLDRAALIGVAKSCGFTVSASRYEGFGLSVIEGMSVGLVPCMQANAAFQETHRLSGCGLLTDFHEPLRAAKDFAQWFPNISRKDRMKAARFAHAQSWEAIIDIYHQHYLRD